MTFEDILGLPLQLVPVQAALAIRPSWLIHAAVVHIIAIFPILFELKGRPLVLSDLAKHGEVIHL